MTTQPARYELRDEREVLNGDLNLPDFFEVNEFDADLRAQIEALEIGQSVNVAGGASGLIEVVRVA